MLRRVHEIEDKNLLYIVALIKGVLFVKYFIAKGANVNTISVKGLSVLRPAISHGWYSCYRPQSMLDIVELLL